MKTSFSNAIADCLVVSFLCLNLRPSLAADPPPESANAYQPAPEEFSALGTQVLELLQTGATVHFAKSVAPSFEDWKSILSTNLPAGSEDPLTPFKSSAEFQRRQVEMGAKALLDQATALHLDFSKGVWSASVLVPKRLGRTRYAALQATNEWIPWAEQAEIVLKSDTFPADSTNGEFRLAARGLLRFPAGWRATEGVQWEAFPGSVADDKTTRKMAILSKVAARRGINGQDDPALLKLGEVLIRFIRERDAAIFEKEAYITSDLLWARFQKSGRAGPSRDELDQELATRAKEQTELALECLKQMTEAGVDLKHAEIQLQAAEVEQAQPQGARGSLDGLIGSRFNLTLAVKSDAKSANGTGLSGEYILAANEITRFETDWKVTDRLHWRQMPDGVLSAEMVAKTKLESYVAEHMSLPPGTAAPQIDFVTLEGEKKMRLSDLKGKVVVLDFWATWCGPCQEPMAELQKLSAAHPDWKDKVAIMPLSIDDELDTVRKHVGKRDWTNTFNVWAGEGGWRAKPVGAFRVSGVPTTYIIDATGKIVMAGHPASLPIEKTVESLLKQ